MTTFLITGGNTGIGLATAIALARDGGRVYIACRSATAGEAALTRIKSESGSGDVRLRDGQAIVGDDAVSFGDLVSVAPEARAYAAARAATARRDSSALPRPKRTEHRPSH